MQDKLSHDQGAADIGGTADSCQFAYQQHTGDGTIIDGLGPDGISARVVDVTNRVVKLQTGYLYHYAFAMLIGAAGLITWFMFGFGGQ